MDKEKVRSSEPGRGIRGLDATTFFRITNFELFAKPNKKVMAVGLIAFTSCVLYIGYMNLKYRTTSGPTYIALSEDGGETLRTRTSRWD